MQFKYLTIQQTPTNQIENLLKANVIGTPGLSMLYQHMGVDLKLYNIAKPHFITVKRNEKVIGTCCFCERDFQGSAGFYVRYFAFVNEFRIKGIPYPKNKEKTSIIRSEIKALLNGSDFNVNAQSNFFHYAYVDPRNPRSANVCEEFGFVPIRKYTTRVFSRIFPKRHLDLEIKEINSSSDKIKKLLENFYKDYNHFSCENLDKTYYYVENGAGKVIAGVQVNADAWRVLSLPGKYGKVLLKAFGVTLFLSRLLSKHFNFLAVEGIYFTAGHEHVFEKLLEKLLYQYKLHTAIMVVDNNSQLYEFTNKIDLGWLAKLSPEVHGDVIVRYQTLSDNFIATDKAKPCYISVHDVS
ncbi:N-acetyltransferase [Chryseotalea sanaruensis]|uniref:N-acetyltransferase n=1 Tax=Chryseotalea sanaruensis TaxID=2482724 RepID=A0A401UF36_9BACT|nr:hypothetical protein [Chryseotalea sanaruensis]GCC53464.1 N-acetyltransferase [Chryseotalea sanaruensis]